MEMEMKIEISSGEKKPTTANTKDGGGEKI